MRELVTAMRIAGIVVGAVFIVSLAWIVLVGPAVFLILAPR